MWPSCVCSGKHDLVIVLSVVCCDCAVLVLVLCRGAPVSHHHVLAPAIWTLITSCMVAACFLPASTEKCGQGTGEGGHQQLPSTLCVVARRGERVTAELKKCQNCTGTQQRPACATHTPAPAPAAHWAVPTWASLFSSSPPQSWSRPTVEIF